MDSYLLVFGFKSAVTATSLSVDSGCSALCDLHGTNTELFTGMSVEKSTLSFLMMVRCSKPVIQTM